MAGDVTVGGIGTLTLNDADAAVLAGNTGISSAGTLQALNGLQNDGAITFSSGRLDIGLLTGSGSMTWTQGTLQTTGLITVAPGSMLGPSLTIDAGKTLVTPQTVVETGGSLTVSGGSYTGVVTLMGGSLSGGGTVQGSVANTSGEVAPGSSPGILTVTGNYSQSSGGSLEVEMSGPTLGSEHDRLLVGGSATLAGALDLSLGYSPAPGSLDRLTVLSADGGLGGTTFDTVPPRDQGGGQFVDIAYTTNEVVVELLQASPGDANGDRQFSFEDIFQVLSRAKYQTGQPATWGDGDWTGDLQFSFDDIFAALSTGNYGSGPYAASGVVATRAPEPSALSLAFTGLLAAWALSMTGRLGSSQGRP
jgi:hypothetical protein